MSDTSDTFVGNAKDIISKIIPRYVFFAIGSVVCVVFCLVKGVCNSI